MKKEKLPTNIIIGPEGDLSDEEYEKLRKNHITECALAPQILRAETAAIAGVAMLESLYYCRN